MRYHLAHLVIFPHAHSYRGTSWLDNFGELNEFCQRLGESFFTSLGFTGREKEKLRLTARGATLGNPSGLYSCSTNIPPAIVHGANSPVP